MREILFRGKRKDNGEWVYGGYFHEKLYYGDEVDRHWIIIYGEFDYDNYEAYEVIPESVGQDTGLTDKNGKKIFEGDIVKVEAEMGSPFFDDMVGKIVYEECSFFIEPKNPVESVYLFADECADIEVIGNIHDNPELLKGGKADA